MKDLIDLLLADKNINEGFKKYINKREDQQDKKQK